jgi:hypothetical protein
MPSTEQSLLYAQSMRAQRREREEERLLHCQFIEDSLEQILERSRRGKAEEAKQLREATKSSLQNKTKFKAEWAQAQKNEALVKRNRQKNEQKEKEESALREVMRVQDVKAMQEQEALRLAIEHREALRLEALKIATMSSQQEVAEIKRRNEEEDRMRYLEERRRLVEDREEAELEKKRARKVRAQLRAADVRDKLQARVRMGSFRWHNGVYGFYDAVRATAVEWVQYEDEHGTPYYYDPISKSTQFREPMDAEWHHYTADERREYDAIHGEGEYDAMTADHAFKDGVNADGGYFNEEGTWIAMLGYFDENYEWVQNEGYYDEYGRFIKYAKVEGDLSFMV